MSRAGRGTRILRDNGNGWEDQGGYMQAKIRKLERQFTDQKSNGEQATSSNIFRGIAIFVNGYTEPSLDELKKLMLKNGGMFHHYYSRSKVTHIIASNLPNSKIDKIHDKKIVKPEWITESVKAGKCLPFERFLLYTARSAVQPGLHRFAASKSTGERRDVVSPPPQRTSVELEIDTRPRGQSKVGESDGANSSAAAAASVPRHSPSKISNARDPGFVAEFYNNSRLHYLSTWGAEFRQYVNELHTRGSHSFPGKERLEQIVAASASDSLSQKETIAKGSRVIMHIDMDCFFVSVGLRKRPDLVGKPVVVTHSRGKGPKDRHGTDLSFEQEHYRNKALGRRGQQAGPSSLHGTSADEMEDEDRSDDETTEDAASVAQANALQESFKSMAEIASCSYEARQAGIKNGMFMGKAKQLCPDLIPIPYDFEGYREVSQKLYDSVASYTHDIEAVSCDELLVDLTDVLNETGASPLQFASILREEIFEKTRCTASVGIGPSVLAAKLATRRAKPNGQYFVVPSEMASFILDVVVRDLPGVGWSTAHKLQIMGVHSCQDLQKIQLTTLQKEFGPKKGQSLYRACRGHDDRPIKVEKERKSVSAEINYGIRFAQDADVNKFVANLVQEVHSRMNRISVSGKTVTLKLKVRAKDAPAESAKFMGHGVCDNITKSVTLPVATDNAAVIHKECMSMIKSLQIPPSEYRGVGIQLSKLESLGGKTSSGTKGMQSILNFASKMDRCASERQVEAGQVETDTEMAATTVERRENTRDDSTFGRRSEETLPRLPTLNSPETHSPPRKNCPAENSDPKSDVDTRSCTQTGCAQQEGVTVHTNSGRIVAESMFDDVPDSDGAQPECSEWNQRAAPSTEVHFPVELLSPKKSSPKKVSPRKKRSPVFKVPRGRAPVKRLPKKLSPKKLKFAQRESSAHREPEPSAKPAADSSSTPADTAARSCPPVTLCGAETLPEVNYLLQEWMTSMKAPRSADITTFVQYIYDLVRHKDLEKVYLVLKSFKRKACVQQQTKSSGWAKAYELVLFRTQTIVQSYYNANLKL